MRPATSSWSAPIVAVSGMTSRPSWIPMPFKFWKSSLIQLYDLLMRGSPVASIAALLGSEKDLRLMPKQSSRESCVFIFFFALYSELLLLGIGRYRGLAL